MTTELENELKDFLIDKPKLLLKFEIILRKFGFTKVIRKLGVKFDTFFDKLTFVSYTQSYPEKSLSKEWYDYFKKLSSESPSRFSEVEIPEESVKFEINNGTQTKTFGYYFRERNYFLLNYDFFIEVVRSDTKNELINFFLNEFVKFGEKVKFERVDTSQIAEKLMVLRINKAWKKKIDDNVDRIKRNISEITTLEKSLFDIYSENIILTKESEAYNLGYKTGTDKVREIFSELKNLKFLKEVLFDNDGIKLKYGDILIKHKNKEYYIGNFDVIISPDEIKIINNNPLYLVKSKTDLKSTDSVFNHPHIQEYSSAICFGSARSNLLTKLRADLEFGKIARQVLLYLKSYNEGDSFNKIEIYGKFFEKDGKRYITQTMREKVERGIEINDDD